MSKLRPLRLLAAIGVLAVALSCGSKDAHRVARNGEGGEAGEGAQETATGAGGVPLFSNGGAEGLAGGVGDVSDGGEISDPYRDQVVLLMHFEGADAETTFIDEIGHAVTPNGAARLEPELAVFGGSSGAFDGASSYLTLENSGDWNFGAADFTIELFVYFKGGIEAQPSIPTLFGFWGPTAVTQAWVLLYPARISGQSGFNNQVDGTIDLVFSTTGSNEVTPAVPWVPDADTWYHLAAVRHGGDFLYFVDGELIGRRSIAVDADDVPDWTRLDPDSNSGDWTPGPPVGEAAAINFNSTARLSVGAGVGAPGSVNSDTFFNGYMDEVRITKGVARYTSSFARPSHAFPDP